MNKVMLSGRTVDVPTVSYTKVDKPLCVARYRLAVTNRFKKDADGKPGADFLTCVAFGKQGEFAEKYVGKGTKLIVFERIQTGSYVNKDGVKVYTTEIIVDEQEFAESKAKAGTGAAAAPTKPADDFVTIPEGLEEELPFV
ncbi:MAG: single-stranded DNA-binding protein [Clostridiales bacterium]|nr:single-stranded DNA-binding protein [Clostridiales bacterium]